MNRFLLLFALGGALFLSACKSGPSSEDALRYNDRIADWTKRIENEGKALEQTMNESGGLPDSAMVFTRFKKIEGVVDSATADINTLTLEGGDTLKMIAQEYFAFEKRAIAQLLPDMFQKIYAFARTAETATEAQVTAFQTDIEGIAKKIEEEENEILTRFRAAQSALATRYGYAIETTPAQ